MIRSTGASTGRAPLRRLAWTALADEQEAGDQVWSALPEGTATRDDIERFLRAEGLAWTQAGEGALYTYADGPRVGGSPVRSEWYLEFRFEREALRELLVELRLIGP